MIKALRSTCIFAVSFLLFAPVGHAALPSMPDTALPVPLVRQETSYSCGAASFLAVLRYFQAYSGDEQGLYPILNTTPEEGTHPRHMEAAAAQFGLTGTLYQHLDTSDLDGFLKQGMAVVVDIQAWPDDPKTVPAWSDDWEDGHYVVLIASDAHYFYFMDPSTDHGYAYINRDEFFSRWHDYEVEGPTQKRVEYNQTVIVYSGPHPITDELSTTKLFRIR